MNTRAMHRHFHIAPIAVCALSLLVAFMAAACASTPQEAIADAGKHALPTIRKYVSSGGAFGETVTGLAGQSLTYRIVLTMPEDIASCNALSYAVIDEPDSAIAPNLASTEARIVDADGGIKAHLDPSCQSDGQRLRIDLGNLFENGTELEFGDRVVVEYPALMAPSIKPGTHRNIAQLLYDTGSGWSKSAKVMACVNTFASSTQTKDTVRNAGYHVGTPKTGDSRMAFVAPALFIALGAIATYTFAQRRRRS